MSDRQIATFVQEIARVLAPSGHLFLWIDKFTACEGDHRRYTMHAPELRRVDFICWNKMRPGMGRRSRCRTEYLVVLQKEPVRAKGIWTDHRLDDCWPEMSDRGIHAHAKPHQLTERLIRAVTKRGDIVLDPCAGGYGVLEACAHTGRNFIGCDLV
jgi:site-specific DNA-methyltransferase (adenine-specific)